MDTFHTAFQYLKYRFRAKNRHGIHSPFVYTLLDKVLYNTVPFYAYEPVEELRRQLAANGTRVHCTELGAGSRIKHPEKTVATILKTAVKPAKYGQFLFRLANHLQAKNMLELGTSLGITTAYLGFSDQRAKVTSIEGCEALFQIAGNNLGQLELQNVDLLHGNFDEVLPKFLAQSEKLDLIYIDGNHREKPTLHYFELCLAHIHPGSVIIIDDIYWSTEMHQAWEKIKAHPRVSVTVDLFQMGLVFFREDQVRQDFVIRY